MKNHWIYWRLLRCPFCLGLVQFLPGLSQLFPGVFRFCLCFLVLALFAPDLLGGALRLLCLAGILRPVRFILLDVYKRQPGWVLSMFATVCASSFSNAV